MSTDEAAEGMQSADAASAPGEAQGEIVAGAGRYFRNARYLIVIGMIACGFWFGLDGWVNWPRDNAKVDELQNEQAIAKEHHNDAESDRLAGEMKNHVHHSDLDLMFQKVLAIGLPLVGLIYLGYSVYRSRGRIRLDGEVLYVPGHQPIATTRIVRIDDRAWERKGISWIYYENENKAEMKVKLDDFVYDHKPIRAIHDRLIFLVSGEAPKVEGEEDEDDGATSVTETREG